jgi:hypothetical protein
MLSEPNYEVKVHTSILHISRDIYDEACQVLYGNHKFDFGHDIEVIVPFLSSITFSARSLIQEISFKKKQFFRAPDYHQCDWRKTCIFGSDMLLTKV